MTQQKSSSVLPAPLHGAASLLRRVPGVGLVGKAAQETLDRVGAVSPRGRRLAVYAGAGVLGVTGVVEWPVALTGAAVAWLTQPRPARSANTGEPPRDSTIERDQPAEDIVTAALHGARGRPPAGKHEISGEHPGKMSKPWASAGPLGPTARPIHTTR
ncbi:hypothetical protein ACFWIO_21625 [Streptomyces diastatochromogenes]|uniref:hypothetical protein n=1 Tax=Streptomyces diastatochromogenes TaxID=42236 RepID=UPI00365A9F6C